MKIELNIEKKHLIVFSVFILLIIGGYVIADRNPDVFHEYLFTNTIEPHTGTVLSVDNAHRLDFLSRDAGAYGGNFWFRTCASEDCNALSLRGDKDIVIGNNLHVLGELCSDWNNNDCIDVDDLIDFVNEGGVVPGGGIVDLTFGGNSQYSILHGGKNLWNDDATARQFCNEEAGTTNFEIKSTSIEGCDIKDLAKYSTSWSVVNCQTNVGYITELECKGVETTVYLFNEGTGNLALYVDPYPPGPSNGDDGWYCLSSSDDNADKFCVENGHLGYLSYDDIIPLSVNCQMAGEYLIYFPSSNPYSSWYSMDCDISPGILDSLVCVG